MEFWQPNSPLNGLAQGHRNSSVAYSYQTGENAHHEELPPGEELSFPARRPEHGVWDEQILALKSITNHKDVGDR